MPLVDLDPDVSAVPVLPDQTGELRQAPPAHLAQVGPNPTPLLLPLTEVLPAQQRLLNPGLHLRPALAREPHRFPGPHKLAHPLGRSAFAMVHPQMHLLAGCPHPSEPVPAPSSFLLPRFQDHLALETIPASGSSCIGQLSSSLRREPGWCMLSTGRDPQDGHRGPFALFCWFVGFCADTCPFDPGMPTHRAGGTIGLQAL